MDPFSPFGQAALKTCSSSFSGPEENPWPPKATSTTDLKLASHRLDTRHSPKPRWRVLPKKPPIFTSNKQRLAKRVGTVSKISCHPLGNAAIRPSVRASGDGFWRSGPQPVDGRAQGNVLAEAQAHRNVQCYVPGLATSRVFFFFVSLEHPQKGYPHPKKETRLAQHPHYKPTMEPGNMQLWRLARCWESAGHSKAHNARKAGECGHECLLKTKGGDKKLCWMMESH